MPEPPSATDALKSFAERAGQKLASDSTPEPDNVLNELVKRGDQVFPDAPKLLHHIGDVRFYLARGIFIGALVIFLIEFLITVNRVPASTSLDALKDTFSSFDTLNAGIFTALGAIIGFYFGKSQDQ